MQELKGWPFDPLDEVKPCDGEGGPGGGTFPG